MAGRISRVVFTLCCLMMVVSNAPASEGIDILEGALASVRSFDVKVTLTRRLFIVAEPGTGGDSRKKRDRTPSKAKVVGPDEAPITRTMYRQVYQAGKGRIETIDPATRKTTSHLVYDTNTQKSWEPERSSGQMRGGSGSLPDGHDYLSNFYYGFGRAPLVRCLRERGGIKLGPTGGALLTLEAGPDAKWDSPYPEWGFRVTLDRNRGAMPTLIEVYKPRNGAPFTEIRREINAWHRTAGGVWVPIKATTKHFVGEGQFAGIMQSEHVMEVALAQSSWNRDIPASTFQINFPPGTQVVDTQRQVMYVTGKTDPGANLDEIVKSAKQITPLVEAPVRVPRRSGWGSGWPGVVAAGAGICLLGGVYWYWRRRAKLAGGQTP